MLLIKEDYKVEFKEPNTISLSGVLRLQSPLDYDPVFAIIKEKLKSQSDSVVVDLTQLEFLNSSGIASIARLIFVGKSCNCGITFKGNKDIPWQKKVLETFVKLWDSGIRLDVS